MTTLYETDFNLWIEQTVNQLKSGDIKRLDLDNLIEEIESMGRNNKREVRSRLIILMTHLLKWQHQPEKQSNSWIYTIKEQRLQLKLILQDSPSLKPFLQQVLDDCYQDARKDAAQETKLAPDNFPKESPYTQTQLLDPDFFPESE
ncbi:MULTISPECIES: DUF29 domain-containing protein [unclassified Synechocystis]|uniref:DUF29 domain-containing protein n=1 Tax=unclassified Synechocystis TaxID=2640012 RepID=UPI0003F9D22A|nr:MULTISPECIES: DUF29 domain-containing protein [unclassified Synechocystis]AIE73400.1 hypothetical protein D082_08710 [Synechocystis sp. PCC 6714]MCT0254238.1 DUF29 domain-containing protein [Synechocystis sp. CS-94]